MSDDFNVKSLCVYMEVSRSGYYKWVKRKGILNRYQSDREVVKEYVIEHHKKHSTHGYGYMAQMIRDKTGWLLSDWLVHKVCKSLGIRSQARKPRWKNPGQEHIQFPNLINNWKTTRPFEKVVTDTTIINNKYGKYELTLFFDIFNNELISYCVSPYRGGHNFKGHMTALKRFLDEKTKRGYTFAETILHSDQGPVYTSRAFNNAHKDYNIKRSMSRVGTPTDNPTIEALNGWIKDELYRDFHIYESKSIYQTIEDFFYYFNNERLAYSLQYKTPIQARLELGFN